MKKIKVEDYKKPNYSTLKMITGKILPAGLVVATMIAGVPSSGVQASGAANANYGLNEVTELPVLQGGIPMADVAGTKSVEGDIVVTPGGVPMPEVEETQPVEAEIVIKAGDVPDSNVEETQTDVEEMYITLGMLPISDVEKPVTVLMNQTVVEFDVEPIIEDGVVFVPFRKIFEMPGAYVTWDAKTDSAIARIGTDTIVIVVNDKKMLKNGVEIALDAAAMIVDSRLLVPLKVISEGLGCKVSWNEANKLVVIEYDENLYDIVDGDMPAISN